MEIFYKFTILSNAGLNRDKSVSAEKLLFKTNTKILCLIINGKFFIKILFYMEDTKINSRINRVKNVVLQKTLAFLYTKIKSILFVFYPYILMIIGINTFNILLDVFIISIQEGYYLVHYNVEINGNGTDNYGGMGNSADSGGSGGGNPNGGQNSTNDALPYSGEEDQSRLRRCMRNRLFAYRLSQANSYPYDTRMGDNFTPAEHEYICDEILKNRNNHSIYQMAYFARRIEGNYPDRRFTGQISLRFISFFFD